MQPSAGGRSHSILTASENDPAWLSAVAPVPRWGKEAWIPASKIATLSRCHSRLCAPLGALRSVRT
eukprot:4782368-Pyramimonas_sp.AAC.1